MAIALAVSRPSTEYLACSAFCMNGTPYLRRTQLTAPAVDFEVSLCYDIQKGHVDMSIAC